MTFRRSSPVVLDAHTGGRTFNRRGSHIEKVPQPIMNDSGIRGFAQIRKRIRATSIFCGRLLVGVSDFDSQPVSQTPSHCQQFNRRVEPLIG